MPAKNPVQAVHIPISDPALQGYLQRHPWCGPDSVMDSKCKAAVTASISFRPPAEAATTVLLDEPQTRLSDEELAAVERICTEIGMSVPMRAIHLNDFGWEANLVPRSSRNVLVIGCGDGVELMFLRAVLPQARITAIDYHYSMLPGLKEAVGVEFLEGDMGGHLRSLSKDYDLIYSNHTAEHLYHPDETLSLLAGLLRPGGYLTSALPMVGMEGTLFLEKTHALIGSKAVHTLDTVYLDAGHPWKTNPGDLKQTMERAGFCDVLLYQRANHLTRPTAGSRTHLESSRRRLMRLHRISFGLVRGLLKALFPSTIPHGVARVFYAAERRVTFGATRLMNSHAEEAFVIGRLNA